MPIQLLVGQRLPELPVQTPAGEPTTVQAYLSSRATLLYFLHGAWCPACVGQLHRLQRQRPAIRAAGADLIVVASEDLEALSAFLESAVPPLEYRVLADPQRRLLPLIGGGADTLAVAIDQTGLIRWIKRWLHHQAEPSLAVVLQALQDVRPAAAHRLETPRA